MIRSLCETTSLSNCTSRSRTRASSFSTAVTRAPCARSARVSTPFPGPISNTLSPSRMFAALMIAASAEGDVKKCCPSDFLAPPCRVCCIVCRCFMLFEINYFLRCAAGFDRLERFLRQVENEFGRRVHALRAENRADARIGEIHFFARARERDVEQPALLLRVFFFLNRIFLVREKSVFEPGDEHHVELQSFGCVHGHEAHCILVFFELILIRCKCGVFQQFFYPLLRRQNIVFCCERPQFLDVLEPLHIVFVPFFEHFLHAGRLNDELKRLGRFLREGGLVDVGKEPVEGGYLLFHRGR